MYIMQLIGDTESACTRELLRQRFRFSRVRKKRLVYSICNSSDPYITRTFRTGVAIFQVSSVSAYTD